MTGLEIAYIIGDFAMCIYEHVQHLNRPINPCVWHFCKLYWSHFSKELLVYYFPSVENVIWVICLSVHLCDTVSIPHRWVMLLLVVFFLNNQIRSIALSVLNSIHNAVSSGWSAGYRRCSGSWAMSGWGRDAGVQGGVWMVGNKEFKNKTDTFLYLV